MNAAPNTISFTVPAFIGKLFNFTYAKQVLVEIIQTAVLAGVAAGLTAVAQQVPSVSAHYGLSPIVTAQIIAIVGAARAFVSGLNSAKAQQVNELAGDVTSAVQNSATAVSIAARSAPPTAVPTAPPASS